MILKILNLVSLLCQYGLTSKCIESVVEVVQSAYEEGVSVGAGNNTQEQTMKCMEEIISHIRNGQKITAIKAYRNMTGLPLRESKTYIDKLCVGFHGYDWDGRRQPKPLHW